MYKGVTPVVATVLLITITIGAAGTLYGIIQSSQEDAENQIDTDLNLNTNQIKIEQCYNQSTNTYLDLRNTDSERAMNTSKITPLLNGTIEDSFNVNTDIVNPKQTFTIEFNNQFGSNTEIILTNGDQQIQYTCYQLD